MDRFFVAVKKGLDAEVAATLESHPEWLDIHRRKYGDTPLHVAAAYGNASTAALLLKLGSTALNVENEIGLTPFFTAVERGQIATAALLMTHMEPVHGRGGQTPLHIAVSNGDKAMVELMLRFHPAWVQAKDEEGYTPMQLALEWEQHAIVNLLRATEI